MDRVIDALLERVSSIEASADLELVNILTTLAILTCTIPFRSLSSSDANHDVWKALRPWRKQMVRKRPGLRAICAQQRWFVSARASENAAGPGAHARFGR